MRSHRSYRDNDIRLDSRKRVLILDAATLEYGIPHGNAYDLIVIDRTGMSQGMINRALPVLSHLLYRNGQVVIL